MTCCESLERGDRAMKRKSERDRCAGNDGTDFVCRAKETKSKCQNQDEIAELVEKLDYNFFQSR